MYFLIPGVDDVDQNIMIKMFPLNYSSSQFDYLKSCCFKTSSGYCNLKVLSFNRQQVFTLDKWLVELGECVFFKKKNIQFPSCHFENQSLTDFFATLLYVVDVFLDEKKLNIYFKERLFNKYKHLFSPRQQYIIVQILTNIWIENEFDQMFKIKHDLERNVIVFNIYSCSMCKFFYEFEKKDMVLTGYLYDLYKKFKADTLGVDSQIVIGDTNVMVIPIQNSTSNWMNASGISKYSTKIFVSSIDKFNRCSRIKNKPPIIFALSFQSECKLFYCIYNQCDFILRRKYKHFLNKNSNRMVEKEINLNLNFYELYRWPFNIQILSFYILFYIYVYLYSTKPKRKNKIDIGRCRLKHAWNLSLKNKQIEFFSMLDFSFLN